MKKWQEKYLEKERNFNKEIFNIENIMKFLRVRYGTKAYYYGEKKYFSNFINWKLRPKRHNREAPVKIGFHSGSLAVTTGNEKITKIYDMKRREYKSLPPLTLWTINKKPMGWCYLEVIE